MSPGNSTLRLADSVNVFETGALAPDVTVDTVDYQILSFDAGMKYKGIFLQTEIYNRWLDNFTADGLLPVDSIHDTGFYLQVGFYPIKEEARGLRRDVADFYGDKDAGFDDSSDNLVGMNFYPIHSRYVRLNMQLIDVNRLPVSSAFGYYVGGQKGTTFATAFPCSSELPIMSDPRGQHGSGLGHRGGPGRRGRQRRARRPPGPGAAAGCRRFRVHLQ